MAIRVYTTPSVPLKISGRLIADSDIYVTFTHRNGTMNFKTPDITVTESGTDTLITVPFTQEQTAIFTVGEVISIEVNWMKNGNREATDIAYIKVTDNLLKEILS